jgi:uroporphyrinogen-III synthase
MNWSGSPASCGNHHLATIGLQGGKSRVDGEVTEVWRESTRRYELETALAGRTVTLLETRRSQQMAALVRGYGGEPIVVPALKEVESADLAQITTALESLDASSPAAAVFQTGVGVSYLFEALTAIGPDAESRFRRMVRETVVIARGPKPTVALGQHEIRIDRTVAAPYTTHEIIAELDSVPIEYKIVLVIRHGGPNAELIAYLEQRQAVPLELEVYHWEMPEEPSALEELVRSIAAGSVDILMFTSASQVEHLFLLAETVGTVDALRAGFNRAPMVAAVGPVCAAALESHGVSPPGGIVQPSTPKMAPLVRLVAETARAQR